MSTESTWDEDEIQGTKEEITADLEKALYLLHVSAGQLIGSALKPPTRKVVVSLVREEALLESIHAIKKTMGMIHVDEILAENPLVNDDRTLAWDPETIWLENDRREHLTEVTALLAKHGMSA